MDEHELNQLLPFQEDPFPLRVDEGGAVRIGTSRISLDLVVEQYENGVMPEDMVRAYDTLVLADVYAVIAYYLRHRNEVSAYLKRRAEEAESLRVKIEAERPRIAREELLARRLIITTNEQSIGSAIDDILLVAEYMPKEELKDQGIVFLPFRG